jgi:hypothetical protein
LEFLKNMESVSAKNHEMTTEGKIHVMPVAFRNVKEGQKVSAAQVSPEKAGNTVAAQPAVTAKRPITPIKIIIGIVLVALVGGSAYLLYLSTQPIQPIMPVTQSSQTVEPIATVEMPAAVETPPVVEPLQEEAVPQEPFKPEKLNEQALVDSTAVDSDKDGLTDLEEMTFSTNPNKADSDQDGYSDGVEVLNLYNPQGTAPVKLEFTNFIKIYTNDTVKYSFFYPESWLAEPGTINDNEVILTSEKGDFINVFTVKKDAAIELADWYLSMVPTLTVDKIEKITNNKYGLAGVISPDGFTYFFAKGDLVYVIHYNMSKDMVVNHPAVLRMIVASFHYVGD